jgi:hypothetical protein
LAAKRGARDRLQTADRLDPEELEIFAQVVIEWQDVDRIAREKGSGVLFLDDQGARGRRMGGRDRADEHRRRHANRRPDANGGVDGTADGGQQLRAVRPAQGQPVETEEGTARILTGSHVGSEVVQGQEQGLADPGCGLLVDRLKDRVRRKLLSLVETHPLDHALRPRFGRGCRHRSPFVRESAEDQWTAAQRRRRQPGGDQRWVGRANTANVRVTGFPVCHVRVTGFPVCHVRVTGFPVCHGIG